jgi:hypothetical protein
MPAARLIAHIGYNLWRPAEQVIAGLGRKFTANVGQTQLPGRTTAATSTSA